MYSRTLDLELPRGQSAFLWGPRKTGKSTLLRQRFPLSARFDLLDTRLMLELTRAPWTLAERIRALGAEQRGRPILIDEVQKVPALLDEVHRLIEDERLGFVLCGSSARKLKRGRANLLGGRAWSFGLHPLTWPEVPRFDLLRALNHGLLPSHYDSPRPRRTLRGYVDDYLKEEILEEGLTRNAPAFSRFFEALAFSHGELVNYSNIARDCGVSSKTAKEYFQILVDTLLGVFVEPFSLRRSRAVITRAPKFYLFDVGVAGRMAGRWIERSAGPGFGRALEHFVLMEILAFRSYRELDVPVRFWRTKSGLECDFVVGREGSVAIEVKGGANPGGKALRGIRAFAQEHRPGSAIVVCNASQPRRTTDGIWVLPWERFLERLWDGGLFE
ncbi:MAG: ATP-binding protein [Gammaproteobacteria bacterium]|nr:ATP-binding protein [Gammaproteobacteria bacterium]MYC51210.1 ATP-binding protein [Gammaproteobacteria bacterium]